MEYIVVIIVAIILCGLALYFNSCVGISNWYYFIFNITLFAIIYLFKQVEVNENMLSEIVISFVSSMLFIIVSWFFLFNKLPDRVEKKLSEGNNNITNDVNRSSENINNNINNVGKTVTSSAAEVGDKVQKVGDKVQKVGEKVTLLDNNFINFNNNFQSQVFTKIEKLHEDSLKKDNADNSTEGVISAFERGLSNYIGVVDENVKLKNELLIANNKISTLKEKIKKYEKQADMDNFIRNLESDDLNNEVSEEILKSNEPNISR